MAYSWSDVSPEGALHPRLEPVSAWLFEENSAFLRSTSASGDAAWLYSMPIGGEGFLPSAPEAWNAMAVPNPQSGAAPAFNLQNLAPALRAQEGTIDDARVYVLPFPDGALMENAELNRRVQLGTPRMDPAEAALPEPEAIVGIIDHGINIFHHRFQRPGAQSRVAYAWMQGAVRHGDRLPFGREWIRADIEAALLGAGGDEDAVLRQIGVDFTTPGHRALGFRTSHGTHVLDLAAGFAPDDDGGAALPIIAVTLPPDVTRETSGALLALPFAMGLEYIADRARHVFFETGKVVPVYVNFSFGLTGGPRSGLHRLERTIAQVAARHQAQTAALFPGVDAPFTVVVAAGNNNLAQGHARAEEGAADIALTWQVQPADPTANTLEVRAAMPSGDTGEGGVFEIAITPPGAPAPLTTSVTLAQGRSKAAQRWLDADGVPIAKLTTWIYEGGVVTLTLSLAATDPGLSGRRPAPSGAWRVSVRCLSALPQRLDAWILRDDVPGGFRDTGRQSYFTDAAYTLRDETGRLVLGDPAGARGVTRAGSLNALVTGARTETDAARLWVVGAVTQGAHGAFEPAPYSATPLDATPEGVDIHALGDRSQAIPGVAAAGTRSGSRVRISGTSVAAPQVLRALATGATPLETPLGPVVIPLNPD